MKKTLRKIAILAMLVALINTTVLGCQRREVDHGAVLSTVNGAEITLGLANFYARIIQAEEEMNHMFSPWAGEDPNPVDVWGDNPMTGISRETEIKDFILENLQGMFLMLENAGDFGVVISPEDMNLIEEAAALFVEQNEQEAIVAVSGQAETVELFLKLMTVSQRMSVAMGAEIDEEVSEEESFQKAADVAFIPFMSVGEDGTSVPMDEIEQGVLAAQVHMLSETADAIGNLEVFEEMGNVFPITFGNQSADLDPGLLEALNALTQVGQMTEAVTTESGIFIGQLTSLFDEEATSAQIEQILEGRRTERVEGLMEEWREAATITVNEELWDQVSFRDLGVEFYQPEVTSDDILEELQLEELQLEEFQLEETDVEDEVADEGIEELTEEAYDEAHDEDE